MDNFLNFLDKNALVSHSLLAILYSSIIMVSCSLVMIVLGYYEGNVFLVCATAAIITSTFFYGREAGQLDHDLSHANTGTVWSRFYTSNIAFFWSGSIFMQWACPALASLVWCSLMYWIVA